MKLLSPSLSLALAPCSSRPLLALRSRGHGAWVAVLLLLAVGWCPVLEAQVRTTAPAAPSADTPATAPAKGDVLTVIKAAGKYGTFLKALDAAGLTDTLQKAGPYTVFAPTDEAFAKLPAGTLDRLLKPESKAKLVAILNYHIAPRLVLASPLAKLDELKTLNGEEIDVDTGTDGKSIEMDDSKIIAPDMLASNGVVHGIDAVLQP